MGLAVLWISIFLFGILFYLVSSYFPLFFESLKSKSTQMLRPQKENLGFLSKDTLLNFGLRYNLNVYCIQLVKCRPSSWTVLDLTLNSKPSYIAPFLIKICQFLLRYLSKASWLSSISFQRIIRILIRSILGGITSETRKNI